MHLGRCWLAFLCGIAIWAAPPSRMSVQVRDGLIRATPSALGSVLVSVPYGTQLETLQQKGDWIQVKSPQGQTGWMHQSALSKKKIVMSSGGANVNTGASSQETVMAGKGFNPQVEAAYKAKNPKLDFAAVDRMEKLKVAPADIQEFLRAGAVKPAEGGAK